MRMRAFCSSYSCLATCSRRIVFPVPPLPRKITILCPRVLSRVALSTDRWLTSSIRLRSNRVGSRGLVNRSAALEITLGDDVLESVQEPYSHFGGCNWPRTLRKRSQVRLEPKMLWGGAGRSTVGTLRSQMKDVIQGLTHPWCSI